MFFIAILREICYNMSAMKNKTRFYVSQKSILTWIVIAIMVCSAVARIVFVGLKGSDNTLILWSQIVLPAVAALLYAILLMSSKELFYKTAIPAFMICIYYLFYFSELNFGAFHKMIISLFGVSLLFISFMYMQISCGKIPATWLLLPLLSFPLTIQLYLQRAALMSSQWIVLLPDILMIGGMMLTIFALRIHPANEHHPTWGDRTDGRRIRTEPPMNQVSPYIMVTRNTSTNFFTEAFEITHVERYIRQKRREGLSNFGLTHVLLACYCRAMCKYPKLNRFIAGQKIFSRGNDIQFCMTIKKEMTSQSPETVIKVHLSPYDTAEDVYRKMNEQIEKVKNSPLDSAFDNTAHALMLIPGVFLKFVVWLLRTLDYFGMLPRFLLEVSPFHGSVFFTSMGSLGIPPIYHHLYDFGNLPVFGSFGCKRRALEVLEDGTVVQRKYLDCKFTLDERIVDGYYYAAFFKHYKRIIAHPELLDNLPEEVLSDID